VLVLELELKLALALRGDDGALVLGRVLVPSGGLVPDMRRILPLIIK